MLRENIRRKEVKMKYLTINERDLAVFKRWQNGDSVNTIARDEHVSIQQVYNIVNKVRVFRYEDVYKDPYDLRYLQSISPRIRKILAGKGVNNIKELTEWVKHNRLINLPGVGNLKEKEILIQLDYFMRHRQEEQDKKS